MTSIGKLWVGVVVAIVIAITGVFTPVGQVAKDAASGITLGTNFKYGISVGSPATLGANPTNFSKVLAGTGVLIANNYTVTASTTAAMDIAVTGAVSGDLAFAQFATSTAVVAGWQISAVSASSTSGFLTLRVYNGTGANALIPASLASTTQYLVAGTQ